MSVIRGGTMWSGSSSCSRIRASLGPCSTARRSPNCERIESPPMDTVPALVFVNRYYRPDESATSQMLTDLAEQLVGRGITVRIICSRQLYEDPDALLAHSEVLTGVHIRR